VRARLDRLLLPSTPGEGPLSFGVPSPRWFLLFAALSIGCSGDEAEAGSPEDAAIDGESADATIDDGTVDSSIDTSPDTSPDSSPDSSPDDATTSDTALDSGAPSDASPDAADTAADSASDTAIDTFFTPPTWSPVCAPAATDAATDALDDAAVDSAGDVDLDAATDAALDDATDDAPHDALDDAPDDATDDATDAMSGDGGACTATRLRVVASNLTSGSSPVYDSPGIHILQALHPDVALMQEFKYPGGMRALVDTAFGPTFYYSTETALGAIPNGIVSRYPILESGEWDDPDLTDRDFVWARIDVPGSIDLFAVSVHLRTTSATARDAEAKNLVAYVKTKVPAGAYLVIGGDCNTSVATESALVDLAEVVTVGPPYASDQAGNVNTNAPRSKPYDWVLPNALLYARMIPVSIGASSYPAGLVFDSRVYTPLSDVTPVLSTDSSATNMQHMAVVRDFAVGD
jgi:hypothetical protein